MAFVRWRGNSAQLLATMYEGGRSRQVILANLRGGYSVANSVRQDVKERYPHIAVDWSKINEALARGPAGEKPLSKKQWEWFEVEQALQQWAAEPNTLASEARTLLDAARVLTSLRARCGN